MHWTDKITPVYSPGDWVIRAAKGGSHPPGTIGQIIDYGTDPNLYVIEIDGAEGTAVGWYDTTFRRASVEDRAAAGMDVSGLEDEDEPGEKPADPYLDVLTRIADALEDIATMSIAAHSKGLPVIPRDQSRILDRPVMADLKRAQRERREGRR